MRNLQLAEGMVQETLIQAFGQWSFGPIPENPSARVMTVAKRKVLNHLKRERLLESRAEAIAYEIETPESVESVFQEDLVGDSMLRMIFSCCHPILPPKSRMAVVAYFERMQQVYPGTILLPGCTDIRYFHC